MKLLLLFLTLIALTYGWRLRERAIELATSEESAELQQDLGQDESASRMSALRQMTERGFSDWNGYKQQHEKSYKNQQLETERMLAYLSNKQFIDKHNQAFREGKKSFSIGENHIADLPFSEYKKLNGYRRALGDNLRRNASTFLAPMNIGDIPESVDWRDKQWVTEVKNQGQCGSCWAFSATGALEGQHARKTGQLVSLSEQNLVDCTKKYGNMGCNGGLMDNAFQYIKDNEGIDKEMTYPYKAKAGRCHFKRNDVGATDTGFFDVAEGDEDKLKLAVATQGPVSVAIDAGHRSFQLYKHGVYFEEECNPEELDHGVLVVGYGTDPEHGDYWIVKNSWSTHWGEQGYIRMAPNRNNNCGIPSHASYPTV
uniref:Cathepsin L-like n=1 Tax=Rotylenchulus reniformis TaxID=239373 RepID=Q3ZCX7_ROTRE|nr:cathepsin L-like cysteine proteinase [Rotylenchulus reniformis]